MNDNIKELYEVIHGVQENMKLMHESQKMMMGVMRGLENRLTALEQEAKAEDEDDE